MKGNTAQGCINVIFNILYFGTPPHSFINKGMFNKAQVEQKGLQIGLMSDLDLVPVCHGHATDLHSGQ